MRHPVSTRFGLGEVESAVVAGRVVGFSVDPGAPQDADPGSGEDAGGMGMVAPAGPGAAVDVGGPTRAVAGVVGEAGDCGAQAVVASPSEDDAAAFAGGVGDGTDAGLGGELVVALEALAHVAELGEDLGGTDAAGAREGHDDLTVGEFGDSVLDARGELGEFADERFENANEGAHELAPGFGLDLADLALRSRAQAVEQLGGGAPAGITVLGEEGPQALLAEPRGAVGGWDSARRKRARSGCRFRRRSRRRRARSPRAGS
jgi:hypothetical protein